MSHYYSNHCRFAWIFFCYKGAEWFQPKIPFLGDQCFGSHFQTGSHRAGIIRIHHPGTKPKKTLELMPILGALFRYFMKANAACFYEQENIVWVSSTQSAGEGVDLAQKRTRPKHAFSGAESPRDQRLLKPFCMVRQKCSTVFEKKLFGY